MADLVFRQPPIVGPSVDLVFGDVDAEAPAVELSLAAALPALTFAASIAAGTLVSLAAGMPPLSMAAQVDLSPDVPALIGVRVGMPWHEAAPAPARAEAAWRSGEVAHVPAALPWRDGDGLAGLAGMPWTSAAPIDSEAAIPWRTGLPLGTLGALPWRDAAVVTPVVAAMPWRSGTQQFVAPLALVWRDAQPLVTSVRSGWQDAARLDVQWALPFAGSPTHVHRLTALPWRDAVPLFSYGGPLRVVPPEPPGEVCYTPLVPAHLVFSRPWSASTDLVYVCDGHALAPPTYVIPLRRTYMAVHTLEIVRLPDLLPLHFASFSITADEGEPGWSFQGSGAAAHFDALAPEAGAPAEIRVTLDGMVWVFAIDTLRRTGEFANNTASVTGRSVTTLLGPRYMPDQSWTNSAPSSAQQAAETALEFTGVTLDWRITDWLVPAGAWTFTGAPLGAVQRIAEAAGAIVQSHRSDAELILMPRYPVLPWEWATATADVQLPHQAVVRSSWERTDRPAWDGVYVSGITRGINAFVQRLGTAGGTLASAVSDALILDDVVARQRGGSILGAAGPQAMVALELPVLTGVGEPGVIDVGRLVEVVGTAETWRGLVRSVNVRCDWPLVRQSITVERHL